MKGAKLKGPLLVLCEFFLPLRKDIRGKKRIENHKVLHCRKPDGDNLEKFINDACKNIVWVDDSQITCMFRTKRYTADQEGKTVMHVTEIPENSTNLELLETLHSILEESHERT